jgi:hypothetical protein
MPTTRTRRQRQWTPDLDDYRRQELLDGPGASLLAGQGYYVHAANHLDDATEAEHTEARTAMVTDWARHRDTLLAWWIGQAEQSVRPWAWVARGGAGTRPWAWWEFDSPEPLPEGETEAAYLARHRLLLPKELPDADHP